MCAAYSRDLGTSSDNNIIKYELGFALHHSNTNTSASLKFVLLSLRNERGIIANKDKVNSEYTFIFDGLAILLNDLKENHIVQSELCGGND